MTPEKAVIYLKLYRQADEVFKRHNPCQIHEVDGKVTCRGTYNGEALCCGGCEHLTPTGCAIEALGCKLWLCSGAYAAIGGNQSDWWKDMRPIRHEAFQHNWTDYTLYRKDPRYVEENSIP